MAFKFVAFFALAAVAAALPQHYYEQQALIKSYQPAVVKKIAYDHHHEHEEPANYDFKYEVHDDHTGDVKEHHETAHNGAVEGYYTLIDADGYRRIVHYTANHEQGFIAKVEREPIQGHKVAQPVVAHHKVVAAPVVQKYISAAPQYYAPAPVVQKVVAAPVVQKYISAPVVQKVAAPAVHKYDAHDFSSSVSFHGPSAAYSY